MLKERMKPAKFNGGGARASGTTTTPNATTTPKVLTLFGVVVGRHNCRNASSLRIAYPTTTPNFGVGVVVSPPFLSHGPLTTIVQNSSNLRPPRTSYPLCLRALG